MFQRRDQTFILGPCIEWHPTTHYGAWIVAPSTLHRVWLLCIDSSHADDKRVLDVDAAVWKVRHGPNNARRKSLKSELYVQFDGS